MRAAAERITGDDVDPNRTPKRQVEPLR